ncbi:MAG: integrase [Blastocatellia bacterium AA13]|nr:MAG: integrase [Blastocatellia bacterium AA13]
MNNANLLGPWIRRFLLEHVQERNLARNTQQSYRDTLVQLVPFVVQKIRRPVERLEVTDVTPEIVRLFLVDIETTRGCVPATRNQRLATIHALARHIGLNSPEHIEWCGQIRSIPFKRVARPLVSYLEKPEMEGLLKAPDRRTKQGQRDYALLLFLYNTGARADEAAHVRVADVNLGRVPERDFSSVLIRGKGNKKRLCPLWSHTALTLVSLINDRAQSEHVFLNRRGRPITRFGIHEMIERYVKSLRENMPSLTTKRVSPHTIRHTSATHLLRAGVDINTIRGWLGHVSLATTNIYAEIDLEMKAEALRHCEVKDPKPRKPPKHWKEDAEIMAFLRRL